MTDHILRKFADFLTRTQLGLNLRVGRFIYWA
jgi:hypothetical protein